MKSAILAILYILCLSVCHTAQAQLYVDWHRAYGGYDMDGAEPHTSFHQVVHFKPTSDGGYIFATATASYDGDVNGRKGGYTDVWIVKMTNRGAIQWKRCYGSGIQDFVNCIQQTSDGGYVFCGYRKGGITDSKAWIVKLDKSGNQSWEKVTADTIEEALLIMQTANNEYLLQCAHENRGTIAWRLDVNGNIIKELPGIIGTPTKDWGYILTSDGDDGYLAKCDTLARFQWETKIGGSKKDQLFKVIECFDGSFVSVGRTYSNDSGITNHDKTGSTSDAMVARVDTGGKPLWIKTFGGSFMDEAYHVLQNPDSTLMVLGYTWSDDGDIKGLLHGKNSDIWIMCLDTNGKMLWQQVIGGSGFDKGYGLVPTDDGGYMLAATTNSRDHDAAGSGYHIDPWDRLDIWIAKLVKGNPASVPGIPNAAEAQQVEVYPTVTNGDLNIMLPEGYEQAAIQMFNTTGQQVPLTLQGNKRYPKATIDNLPAGMYLLRITGNGVHSTHKIIYQP